MNFIVCELCLNGVIILKNNRRRETADGRGGQIFTILLPCLCIWLFEKLPKEDFMLMMLIQHKDHGSSRALSQSFQSVQLDTQSCPTFVTPWTAAHQTSLSITSSQSLLRLMSIESVMPSNRLILCRPLLFLPSVFPSIRVFSNEFFASGGQSIGVSASASVLLKNIQDWSPLGWTGWISLQSKGLSRVFCNTIVQKHQFFGAQLSL